MLIRAIQILLLFSLIALGFMAASAQQGADNNPVFTRPCEGEDLSKFAKETCVKMRIERENKDHDEMLERGEEVRRLAERLEKSFAQNGRLSDTDRAALEAVEKDAKKIRDALGGSNDDENIDEVLGRGKAASFADAVDTLKTVAINLSDELKKTTRFSISATAIQSSNAVLTVARFLRIKN